MEETRLAPGTQAPSFNTVTYNGIEVKLENLQGKKVWLMFYRYFGCPLCMKHMFDVSDEHDVLEQKNVEVIAIFDSPRFKVKPEDRGRKFPPFLLVADPDRELYSLYGVEKRVASLFHPQVLLKSLEALVAGFIQPRITGALGRIPAHFLIHEDGTIHTAYYGNHVADQLPPERLKDFLDSPPRLPKKKKK